MFVDIILRLGIFVYLSESDTGLSATGPDGSECTDIQKYQCMNLNFLLV